MLILILCIISLMFVCGLMFIRQRVLGNELKKYENRDIKWSQFYYTLVRWIYNYQNDIHITDYMKKNEYMTLAIYGTKELGELLYGELKNTDVKVLYFIDREADGITSEIPIYKPDGLLPEVDVVVVTAIYYYSDIETELKKKGMNVVSLEDLVYELR